jgi:hypothetical protein
LQRHCAAASCHATLWSHQAEFQKEREDMLDTIRELTRQLKFKHIALDHYIPHDELKQSAAAAARSLQAGIPLS